MSKDCPGKGDLLSAFCHRNLGMSRFPWDQVLNSKLLQGISYNHRFVHQVEISGKLDFFSVDALALDQKVKLDKSSPGFMSKNCSRNFSSVQLLSCILLFVTPWTAACPASLSITNSQSLLKLMAIESVIPSNHLTLCYPLLLLPSIFPSIRVFSNESVLCIRWPKYWSFSFSISPSNEHSGLISFRIDWLDLLSVHGTLKSLCQHHSSKASNLQHSVFFIVQLISVHNYWKNHSFNWMDFC